MNNNVSILFLIIYILFNELTYDIACDQANGLNHHIASGDLCWINRILLGFAGIWYFGFIGGAILFLSSLFGMVHATIGWILSIWTFLVNDYSEIRAIVELRASFVIVANIITLVFCVASLFFAKYKCLLSYCLENVGVSVTVGIVLIVGFIIRSIIVKLGS